MSRCLFQRQMKQNFPLKYGHSLETGGFPRDTTFHNFSQQFSQLHFYNFIWQKNCRQLKIVDLIYCNTWITGFYFLLFCYSVILLYWDYYFKFWKKTRSEKVGHSLIHLLIIKSIFFLFSQKNVPVANSFNNVSKLFIFT